MKSGPKAAAAAEVTEPKSGSAAGVAGRSSSSPPATAGGRAPPSRASRGRPEETSRACTNEARIETCSGEMSTSPDAIASSDEQPKLSQSRGIFQARGRPVERRCSKREPVSNRHAAPSGGSGPYSLRHTGGDFPTTCCLVEWRCRKREPLSLEPLCRMIGAGRGPLDRANFIQRGESERAVWCLPGGADLPWCAAAGAQLPGHWSRFGPLCRMIGAGRGPSDRANFIQRGESERAVWCLPGGADLPWCAAAGAQLPGHWIRFGASLPHGRRRERPVGPGQFHSERRIRAGRVVPPGRCGFAKVRRRGGATARPLESIWSLSAA